MKELVRYGFILAVICILASASLAGVNSLTRNKIIAQAQAEEELSLKEIFPDADRFQAVNSGEEASYYKVFSKDGNFIGIAFKASGKGYSSVIQTMSGLDKQGKITAIKVLSQNETPGLGAKVTESSFTQQFSNKNIQNLSQVQAITGATISSRAVIDSVSKKAQELRELIKDER